MRFCEESAGAIYRYLRCGRTNKMSGSLLISSLLVLRTGGLAPLIPCFWFISFLLIISELTKNAAVNPSVLCYRWLVYRKQVFIFKPFDTTNISYSTALQKQCKKRPKTFIRTPRWCCCHYKNVRSGHGDWHQNWPVSPQAIPFHACSRRFDNAPVRWEPTKPCIPQSHCQ